MHLFLQLLYLILVLVLVLFTVNNVITFIRLAFNSISGLIVIHDTCHVGTGLVSKAEALDCGRTDTRSLLLPSSLLIFSLLSVASPFFKTETLSSPNPSLEKWSVVDTNSSTYKPLLILFSELRWQLRRLRWWLWRWWWWRLRRWSRRRWRWMGWRRQNVQPRWWSPHHRLEFHQARALREKLLRRGQACLCPK